MTVGHLHDRFGSGRTAEPIHEFRAAHAYPLQKATMGLRSMVATERCQVEASQRLKRIPAISNKIAREPTMARAKAAPRWNFSATICLQS